MNPYLPTAKQALEPLNRSDEVQKNHPKLINLANFLKKIYFAEVQNVVLLTTGALEKYQRKVHLLLMENMFIDV